MKKCKVIECKKTAHNQGWCSMHHSRLRRHGTLDPTVPKRRPSDISEANWFWLKVDKTEECWFWTAHKKHGYGQYRRHGKQ